MGCCKNAIGDFKVGIEKQRIPVSQCLAEGTHVVRVGRGEGAIESFGSHPPASGNFELRPQVNDGLESRFVLLRCPNGLYVLIKEENGSFALGRGR